VRHSKHIFKFKIVNVFPEKNASNLMLPPVLSCMYKRQHNHLYYCGEILKYYLTPSLADFLTRRAALRTYSIGPQPSHKREGWGAVYKIFLCLCPLLPPSSQQTSLFLMHKLNAHLLTWIYFTSLLFLLAFGSVRIGLGVTLQEFCSLFI
jgi:hypothetical protein